MILDLVIPYYNPKEGWEQKLVGKFNLLVNDHFGGNRDAVHVIVVNDGSIHHFTQKETAYLRQHIPGLEVICYEENKGKGHALRTGVAAAVTDYCVYSDNDFPFGLAAIREMYEALQQGADIVTGCRTHGNYFRHLPFKRRVVSRGLAFVNKYLLRLPITDTQAGIKGFNRRGREIFLKTTTERFLFDLEFVLLAGKTKGITMREIDVNIVEGTKMTDFSGKILRQEFRNLLRILFKRKHEKQAGQDII